MHDLENRIVEYLSRPNTKPVRPSALARKLKVGEARSAEFGEALNRLLDARRIAQGPEGTLRARSSPGMVSGTIKRISSGAGFVIPHETPGGPPAGREHDIFIAAQDVRDAHTGDEVLVKLLKRRHGGGKRTGRVVEVLTRATNTFVGTYLEHAGQGYVRVDGNIFVEPVYVGDPGAKGAQPDDKVVIEMLRFPMHGRPGEAVLTKVLGTRGEPGVDTQVIIHEFGLPDEFPEEVLAEASEQAARFDEANVEGRVDLTKEIIVTIDPVDARDFDDAISLSRSDAGHWHLGVHIADVAHFVRPGSQLDREGYLRGNSVYLPRKVLPMLPEVISNGLASLQQGKVRYTKSVLIEFTAEGVPVSTEFLNSAIKVTRRFAYEEVLPIIQEPERFKTRVPAKIRKLLADMHELAMILRRRRFEAGALELNLREVKLDFDKDGRVTGAHEVAHDESHQIIEEFMLAANTAVATELDDRGIPFLRRIHGDPDLLKLRAFASFVTALGHPLKQFQSRHHLQAIIDEVRGQPTEHAINYALLRSMKQAEYAGVEMGHYALAAQNYCHFTSPIRRYPDLTVHRLVDAIFTAERGQANGRKRKRKVAAPNEVELEKAGKHCSATERRAASAERELTKIKLLTYMSERIGEELDAIVTGVEPFGIFCQGLQIPVEGMIHISALDRDDYFYHDESTFSLIGRRTGKQYRLGDTVRVSVAHVDVDRRELDFRIVEQVGPGRRGRPQPAKRPRADDEFGGADGFQRERRRTRKEQRGGSKRRR